MLGREVGRQCPGPENAEVYPILPNLGFRIIFEVENYRLVQKVQKLNAAGSAAALCGSHEHRTFSWSVGKEFDDHLMGHLGQQNEHIP